MFLLESVRKFLVETSGYVKRKSTTELVHFYFLFSALYLLYVSFLELPQQSTVNIVA